MRSQSAMEYLISYGWAIVLIAIVLVILVAYGAFSNNVGPRAQPGSCSVYHPYGAGISMGAQLEGVCSSEPPEYVANFEDVGSMEGGFIPLPNFNYTISIWFNVQAQSGLGCCTNPIFDVYNAFVNNGIGGGQNFDYASGFVTGQGFSLGEYWPTNWQFVETGAISTGHWHNVIVTSSDYNTITIYIDGAKAAGPTLLSISDPTVSQYLTTAAVSVGSNPPGGDELASTGTELANLQVYGSVFSQNSVTSLYLRGIGGVPLNVQSLLGWWPLNGNTNDYSGSATALQPYAGGFSYSSSWTSGYTAP